MNSKTYTLLLALVSFCFSSISLDAADKKRATKEEKTIPGQSLIPEQDGPGYTINFDNVSIIELIKFLSKVSGANFIYSEDDLNFNVTIVSEESAPLTDVMAAFIQVLRINGFDLIEQGNNLVVSKGTGIRQIAPVVSAEVPLEGAIPPMMTRVFQVKNANPATLAGLLGPLLSQNAIIEVSEATRHIIVTDITQNIEEVYKLFFSLDIPRAALDIDSYAVRNNTPQELIALVTQIIVPISEGNPLIYVSQPTTNTIFIISTPFLIEKSLAILEDLDAPPSLTRSIVGPLTEQNILIYHIKNKPADVLQNALKGVENNLSQMGPASQNLVQAINSMKFVRESHSLMFVGDSQSLDELKTILDNLDIPYSEQELEFIHGGFFIYKIQNSDEEEIAASLEKFSQNLNKSPYPDSDLINAINSMKWIKENNSLVFTGDQRALERLKKLLPSFDVPSAEITNSSFYIYTPKSVPGDELMKQLTDTYKNLKNANLADPSLLSALSAAKWSSTTNTINFTGNPQSLDRIKALLAAIDQPKGPPPAEITTYVYHIQYVEAENLEEGLEKLAKSLPEEDMLVQTIETMKYIPQSNSLVFRGPVETINQLKTIIPTMDNPKVAEQEAAIKATYVVYKLQSAPGDVVMEELNQTAKSIKGTSAEDKEVIESIKNIKWIQSTNSLVITGPSAVIERIKTMIAKFDFARGTETNSAFYVYKPTGLSANEFQAKVQNAAKEMDKAGLNDPDLIQSLASAKVVSGGQAVMFTGTPTGIEKVKQILATFDLAKAKESKTSEFYIYKPTSITADQLKDEISKAATHLQKSGLEDPELIDAMNSARLSSNSTQVIFTGTPEAIQKIKMLVASYDNPQLQNSKATQYFIFKPESQTPQAIIKQAAHTADEMKDSGFADPNLIAALDSGTVVSQGTGVLFTGTPDAMVRVKEIVPTFDIPVETTPQASEFYVYKPSHISSDELRRHARIVADDMEGSGLADQVLISTLKNTRLVSNGKGVLFTGTKESIDKVKQLLPTLDSPGENELRQVGKTTFTIYKIKYLTGPALMGYLRNMAGDLKQAGSTQDDLITTLNNLRYVKETNSLIFTGTPTAVQEATLLAEKFDIPALAQEEPTRVPSGYVIYKPKYVPGEELLKILQDFEQNLVTSGVHDKGLFDTINNLKWMDKTSSILISGDQVDTKKVFELLERFDIPGSATSQGEAGIETVSDTSFLIYKLQYHSGDEIQSAIKTIGADLGQAKSQANTNLAEAIKTLQWVQVTNSLIATGQPDALNKLKELIKSIDVPLKQVFVEVLVIETQDADNLEFGLRWGSQGNYLNKFAYAGGVFPQNSTSDPDPLSSFYTGNNSLQNINATTTPSGNFIPFSSGGDLGIIGDIILHKGQTYFALGSLINALRVDSDSTIVMNQKIITQDNKTSTIFSGQNIPYTGSLVTNSSQTTVQTANLEYRDVGISLSITPVVGNNDVITLMIEEDISELADPTQASSSTSTTSVTGITTNKSSTKTVVSLPDKSFLVLTGTMQNTVTHSRTSLPCLGGLPIIGAAFSENQTAVEVSNLIIFVRPHIIKSFDTYAEITARQEDIYRSQADAEAFDAGLELVKTPDDTY